MIPNGEGWHYLAAKTLSTLLRIIMSKRDGTLYCLNCLHSFRTKTNLNLVKTYVKIKFSVMPSKITKILQFTQHWNSNKTPWILYAALESFIKKVDGCKNNLEKSSITKVSEHIPWGYSIFMIWVFDGLENRYDVYRGEYCLL